MAVGGGSAERRAEELGSSGDPAAGAWAAGAEGEKRVAAALSQLPEAWSVLHDRLLRPGRSDVNLDHVVVGPPGIVLIDAKNRAGKVAAWDGGLFQHTSRDGISSSSSLAHELDKVRGMAAYMSVESGIPVTPVLCLAGAREAEFGEPQPLRGVWVVPVSRLVPWLQSQPPMYEPEAVRRIATRAMTDFPSTTTHPELLAAIGQAAAPRQGRRGPRRRGAIPDGSIAVTQRGIRAPARRRHRSSAARVRRGALALVLGLAALWALPSLARFASVAAAPPEAGGLVTATTQPTASGAPHVSRAAPSSPAASVTPTLSPTDCARATGTEIARIIRRRIYPVAVSSGCAWGTRLDDPSTVVVSITMSAQHSPFDYQFQTSEKQGRVVFGVGYDLRFRPATILWVVQGAPLAPGGKGTRAVADIQVKVSSHMLSLSEDPARRVALAIANAANT